VDGALIDWMYHPLAAMFYAMPRLFAFFSMMPMLGHQGLPGMLRASMAGAMGLMVAPGLYEHVVGNDTGHLVVLAIIIKEVMLGYALGFIMAIPLWAFETMGAYVDAQRGASIAEAINPLTGHDTSVMGQLFNQAAVTFLLASGGFLLVLRAVYDSYRLWPVFDWWPRLDTSTPQFLLGEMDMLFHLTVLLSAPVIIAMFLGELGLALVSRFAPQLQVFFLAMPIKSGLAIFVFAIYATTMFDFAGTLFANLGNDALARLSTVVK
jgi:type III secretion protein T